jgi:hypothetical protein
MTTGCDSGPGFEGCGKVDMSFYARHFPEVHKVLLRDPRTLSVEDTCYILTKLASLGDFALVCHFLPPLTHRHAHSHIPRVELLYARLLDWRERWSLVQYRKLTDSLLTHWSNALAEHKPPHRLTVFSNEVSFLLLWLTDYAPIMPYLCHLAEMFRTGKGDAEWAAFHWVPFIESLQADPIGTLVQHATAGTTYELPKERVAEVKHTLTSSGLVPHAF